jgi:hypothetical protein
LEGKTDQSKRKSRDMWIRGCDFHSRFQQMVMLDSESGEFEERRLDPLKGEVRAFYSSLTGPARREKKDLETILLDIADDLRDERSEASPYLALQKFHARCCFSVKHLGKAISIQRYDSRTFGLADC